MSAWCQLQLRVTSGQESLIPGGHGSIMPRYPKRMAHLAFKDAEEERRHLTPCKAAGERHDPDFKPLWPFGPKHGTCTAKVAGVAWPTWKKRERAASSPPAGRCSGARGSGSAASWQMGPSCRPSSTSVGCAPLDRRPAQCSAHLCMYM